MKQLSFSIVNLKRTGSYDIRIDRSSPYGNPFIMSGYSSQERDRVINEFNTWIWKLEQQALRQKFFDQVQALAESGVLFIKLACWCAPEPCHGDVWVEVYQQMVAKAIADHVNDPNGSEETADGC